MAPEPPCRGCGKRPCVCKFPPALLWRRRLGLPLSRPAHAFLDGEPVCESAALPEGHVTGFQGRKLKAFEDAPMAPTGRPYGRTCEVCEGRLKVRGLAA